MAVPVEFAVLGDVRAWRDGRDLYLGSPQQRAMLGLLLLRECRPVPLDELIDQMWGADPPPSARVTVRTYISRLRRSLAHPRDDRAAILSAAGGYALPVPPQTVDLAVFTRRVAEARTARTRGDVAGASASLHAALSLWRGRALAGAHGQFVEQERSRLEQLRLAALEERIVLDLELGRHADLVPELTGLVSTDPLRERLRELLMLALYRAGRQADALNVYQQIRALLNQELGIDPGPGMRTLHQQILRSAPEVSAPAVGPRSAVAPGAPGRPAPAQLPADVPDFSGRTDEVAHLTDILCRTERPRIAGLTGLDGMGKTTLAVHTAHLLRDRFPDGQFFADLGDAGWRAADPFDVLGRFLRAVGTGTGDLPDTVEERAALWRSLLHRRRMLIVLDDAATGEQLRHLLPGSPHSAALITSSRRMNDLPAVSWRTLTVMPPQDATQLLTTIIGPDRERDEPDPCARLLLACSYQPLALRVLAARILARPTWTLAQIEQQMHEQLTHLAGACEDRLLMSTPITRAESRLTAEAAAAFRLASIPAISALSPDSASALLDVPRSRASAVLDSLIDAHLLEALPNGRYGFLDAVRTVARHEARLNDGEVVCRAALERLGCFYLRSELNARCAINGRPPVHAAVHPHHPVAGLVFATPETARTWLADSRVDRVAIVDQLVGSPFATVDRCPVDPLTAGQGSERVLCSAR